MSIRFFSVLALAVLCGGSAAVGMNRLQRSTGSDQVPTVSIVIATADIPRGSTVSEEMLAVRNWPADLLPDTALHSVSEAVDRAAMVPIVANDLILEAKLAPKNAGRGLAPLIPDGMRAYTIQTSKLASNVAGFVLPGNHVDVLLTLKGDQNDQTGGGSSTTLLQAVEILAVDQRLDAPADNKTADMRSVTLLVSPRQAAFLDLGQNLGQLTLSLRNPQDVGEGETQPATLADLRFRQEPLKNAPAMSETQEKKPVSTYRIRTLRGSHAGEVAISKVGG